MIVSFIIVAYNSDKKVNKLLENILKQTYPKKKIELILVDSISEDKTRDIFLSFKDKYSKEFSQVLFLENKKRTLPCGWNLALKKCTGDIIIRVDAHATIPNDFVECNVNLIKSGETIVGGQRPSIIDDNNAWQRLLLTAEKSMFGSGIASYRTGISDKYVSTLAHAAYSRKVFEDVGGYDERLARTEDNEIHYRMKKAGNKFFMSHTLKSYHHVRSTLIKMLKQKYLNGYWIGLTMGVSPKCFSYYHFIPLLFATCIIFGIVGSLFWGIVFLNLLLATYFIGAVLITLLSLNKSNASFNLVLLPIIFFILHCSYGLGTLFGLLYMPLWKRKIENRRCDQIEEVKRALLKNSNDS